MSVANDSIDAATAELAKLKANLKMSKQVQIRSVGETSLMKATAHTWFNNHRKNLAFIGDEVLSAVDSRFHSLLESGDINSSRKSVLENITQLRKELIALRKGIITFDASSSHNNTEDSPPDFSRLISDELMKAVLVRRWIECSICVKNKANLAATVMIGGLVEGLLISKFNQESDPSRIYKAKSAPKDRVTGKVKQLSDWKLNDLINLAHELTWISKPTRDIGSVLRDYRNYIHPHKEVSEKVTIQPEDASMFWEIAKNITRQLVGAI